MTTLRTGSFRPGFLPLAADRAERPAVVAEAVRVAIGGRHILDGVDLRLAPATVVVLLGENGAGKTTLLRTLCGRSAPTAGRVRIEGHDPRRSVQARRAIGYVPQSVALYPELTVRENLRAFGAYAGQGRGAMRSDRDIMASLDLAGVADRRVGQLSGGYQRRVNLGAALAASPSFLVLDEPTVGLDGEAKTILLDVIRQEALRGAAVLLTTHDLDAAAAIADRLALLVRGRIVAEGEPHALLDRVFGERLSVTYRPARPVAPELARRLAEGGLLVSHADGTWRSPVCGVAPGVVALLSGMVAADQHGLNQLAIMRPGLGDLYEAVTKEGAGP